jgi:hypothetical protein
MAIAYVQEFDGDENDRSTTNYDTSGTGAPPAREYTYELHDLVRG